MTSLTPIPRSPSGAPYWPNLTGSQKTRGFVNQAIKVSSRKPRPRLKKVNLEEQAKDITYIDQRILVFSLIQTLFLIHWSGLHLVNALDGNNLR